MENARKPLDLLQPVPAGMGEKAPVSDATPLRRGERGDASAARTINRMYGYTQEWVGGGACTMCGLLKLTRKGISMNVYERDWIYHVEKVGALIAAALTVGGLLIWSTLILGELIWELM